VVQQEINPSLSSVASAYRLLANDSQSYQYLVESIRMFPGQEEFAGMVEAAGFAGVDYENLSGGVVAIHSGYKPTQV
jgi:ubiquinone/menaquinone biosynthesis C-methylase UbiE